MCHDYVSGFGTLTGHRDVFSANERRVIGVRGNNLLTETVAF
jgi:hypothetical protein